MFSTVFRTKLSDWEGVQPKIYGPESSKGLNLGPLTTKKQARGLTFDTLEGLSLNSFPRLKSSTRTAVSIPERREIVQWAILDGGLGEFLRSSPSNFHKIDNYLYTLIPSYHRKFSVIFGGSNVYSIYVLKRSGRFFQQFQSFFQT